MDESWQLQDAKQRLSELLRRVETAGPQFVTRHGEKVAAVVDIAYYERLTGVGVEIDFKDYLHGPSGEEDAVTDAVSEVLDEVVGERKHHLPREVDLGAGA